MLPSVLRVKVSCCVDVLYSFVCLHLYSPQPFPGNPLDPPLRSRFQAFRVDPVEPQVLLEEITHRIAPHGDVRLFLFA
jgi:hypothetical protein